MTITVTVFIKNMTQNAELMELLITISVRENVLMLKKLMMELARDVTVLGLSSQFVEKTVLLMLIPAKRTAIIL